MVSNILQSMIVGLAHPVHRLAVPKTYQILGVSSVQVESYLTTGVPAQHSRKIF